MSKKEKAEAIRRADNKMIASLQALGKLEGEEEEYRQAGLKGIQFKRGLENVSQSLAKKLLGEWAGKPLKKLKPKKLIKKFKPKKLIKKLIKKIKGGADIERPSTPLPFLEDDLTQEDIDEYNRAIQEQINKEKRITTHDKLTKIAKDTIDKKLRGEGMSLNDMILSNDFNY
jgi:hypothetical protein